MEKYLKLFLEKLPEQTMFDQMEVVLDHNEPTEQEMIWVKEFQEKYPNRLKHMITNPVIPIGNSMNKCIRESSGDYLAIWNVDDLRTKNSVQLQSKILDSGFDIAHGNFIITNQFGSTDGEHIDHAKYGSRSKEYTRSMVLGPFFMWRKSMNLYFDEQLKSGADFDLAIRLALYGKIGVTSNILGYYLNEGKGASTNGDGKQQLERTVIEQRYGILDKIEPQWLKHPKYKDYDPDNLYLDDVKYSIQDLIPNYNSFIENNKIP
jgi:hypothetical protein